MKKIILSLFILTIALSGMGQIINKKIVDDGGSGPYKAFAVTESAFQNYVIYRPQNIKEAYKKEGKLPVLIFANGGCNDTSITHEKVLNEIASHGYVVIALGSLQMDIKDREIRKADNSMMIDAIDWIINQNKNEQSEYFKMIDTEKIASGGQSCGGAQVLYEATDPRIKTYMMFNSGIGDMTMADATVESLKKLHCPIIYLIGGSSDVAYKNAKLDYERIDNVPVVFANLGNAGHMSTFAEKFGGTLSRMSLAWLDWQLKNKKDNGNLFIKKELKGFPEWTLESKNF